MSALEQPEFFTDNQEEQFEMPSYLNISKDAAGDDEETMFAADNILIDAAQNYVLKLD